MLCNIIHLTRQPVREDKAPCPGEYNAKDLAAYSFLESRAAISYGCM
ncbi:hypothetical protein RUMHYD_02264 [Blautia hydrogenotrophica DSM 10507]|uniref:Uncharacterized protein n=1 Tax=Blautia hydrogenotrophica (strain DSM 10507 / JCM 14656 / S5a33) TaxID=476272 RepID=C0CN26_BLAHS|nr:hypothetical protein RUMHYD_02264 [Blautia hydrogenotrophica DSM 10507]